MIYIKITDEMLKSWKSEDFENNRKKLQEVMDKFSEADKALEKVCLELGIEKPEMVCCNDI